MYRVCGFVRSNLTVWSFLDVLPLFKLMFSWHPYTKRYWQMKLNSLSSQTRARQLLVTKCTVFYGDWEYLMEVFTWLWFPFDSGWISLVHVNLPNVEQSRAQSCLKFGSWKIPVCERHGLKCIHSSQGPCNSELYLVRLKQDNTTNNMLLPVPKG